MWVTHWSSYEVQILSGWGVSVWGKKKSANIMNGDYSLTLQPWLFFHLLVFPERGLAEQRDGETSECCCKRVKAGMTSFNIFKAGWCKGKQTGVEGLKQRSLRAHLLNKTPPNWWYSSICGSWISHFCQYLCHFSLILEDFLPSPSCWEDCRVWGWRTQHGNSDPLRSQWQKSPKRRSNGRVSLSWG